MKTYQILFWAFPIIIMLIGLLLRIFVKKKSDIVPETAGEVRIGEMYCKTKQVKFKGLLVPPFDGKLILTDYRLMYIFFNSHTAISFIY